MDTKKLVMVGGAGLGAYLLYRWWQGRQQAVAPQPEANGMVAPVPPAPPTSFVGAPPAKPPVTMPLPTTLQPTEQQAVDPAYWEGLARNIASRL
jgi:hypothetical protein